MFLFLSSTPILIWFYDNLEFILYAQSISLTYDDVALLGVKLIIGMTKTSIDLHLVD